MNLLVQFAGNSTNPFFFFFISRLSRLFFLSRTKNYQKKMTHLGYHGYEKNCAKIIQKYWRGYQTRKEYKLKLRRYYKSGKGNSILRQKYYEKEFSTFSNHMDKSIETRTNQVNDMLK